MNRSNDYVFVAFCLLAQGVRARGIVRKFAATIKPVLKLLMDLDINIVQMPCPELIFDSFHRSPCGKKKYDTPSNRLACRKVAEQVVDQLLMMIESGCRVRAILGIENSPSCAVTYLGSGPGRKGYSGQGIFIEELRREMNRRGVKVPIVGVRTYHIHETTKQLEELLRG